MLFAKEVFCFEPDDWQREVLTAVPSNNRITIRSGQGVGKTALESIIAWWFLVCFSQSKIIATAPTEAQLKAVFWSELAKWRNRSELLQSITRWHAEKICIVGNEQTWFGIPRTATKPENMQGFHADNMLFIVDEASGIDDDIMEAILGTLSGGNNKLLMFGNPTKTTGTFYDSHNRDKEIYKGYKISSLDSPRTSPQNIEILKRKYGEDSNVYRVRVLGEFPKTEDDAFFSRKIVERSMFMDYEIEDTIYSIDIGCDIARAGGDKTVIAYKVNKELFFYKKEQQKDTMQTLENVLKCGEMLMEKYNKRRPIEQQNMMIAVKIDETGLGGTFVDALMLRKKDNPDRYWWLHVVGVKFGAQLKPKLYPHVHDTTTLMADAVKSMLNDYDDKGIAREPILKLPDNSELMEQLINRKYSFTGQSRMRLEGKGEMRSRGQRSPDESDAVFLTCFQVYVPTEMNK